MRKLKVLFVRSGNNGIEPISTLQGQSLAKIGVEVIYYDVIGRGYLGYILNVPQMRSFIKKNKPDIIHAHYSDKGILSLLTFTNIPIVVSLMGSDVLAGSISHSYLLHICTKIWDTTIVKSKELLNVLSIKKNVVVLPNGIDFDVFQPVEKNEAMQRIGWNPKLINILFCSDPQRREKNYELAEKALQHLDPYKYSYKIHFLKNIPIPEMKYYYSAADILLMTSLYEGSPNVIKEAMACNCPIVSTDVGDVKEVLAHTAGCYVTSFDDKDICEKILLAMQYSKQRTQGRENVKHLDSKVVADKLVSIYDNLLKRKS